MMLFICLELHHTLFVQLMNFKIDFETNELVKTSLTIYVRKNESVAVLYAQLIVLEILIKLN